MIKTFILGSGYLSKNLKSKIPNSSIFTIDEFISVKIKEKKKFNLIVNSFYSSRKLEKITSYNKFVYKSLSEISFLIDSLNPKSINKIIYTSSSSVYGSINNKIDINDKNNRYIYSSLKLSAETLLKNYCNSRKIPLIISRLFNLYGAGENFSIISKINNLQKRKSKKLKISNQGMSIRDFIHVNDVVAIYKRFLSIKKKSFIYDVGTGKGVKIIDIITTLNLNKKIIIDKKKIPEINQSIANNNSINENLNFKNYISLDRFFKSNKITHVTSKKTNLIENNLFGSIIYGCGYAGLQLANQILSFDKGNISFFVDDDLKKIGKYYFGIKVISFDELKNISLKIKPRNIILAIPSLSAKERFNIIKRLLPICQSVSTLPMKKYIHSKNILISDLEEISFENFFNRNFYEVDKHTLKKFKNQKILITGGAGSIGKEICKQLIKSNPSKIVILDHSELNIYKLSKQINTKNIKLILGDIKDEVLINRIINKFNFQYIFHVAAYKHVKFLESNASSAVKNNIIGTNNIINSIKNKRTNFTFVSTDKAVKPKNILGMTKRIGEILVQYSSKEKVFKNCKINIVRFGNVLGSDGSALPLFINQILNDKPVTLTDKKMMRYFMTIKEACSLVIKSSQIDSKSKICVLDMGKPVKVIDLIEKIFKIFKKRNQKLKIKIVGNKFNEKISEKLFYKSSKTQKIHPKILLVEDPIPSKKILLNFINQVSSKKILNNDNLVYSKIKNFFKVK